jgi:flagellar hook-basal body complex protein FliE
MINEKQIKAMNNLNDVAEGKANRIDRESAEVIFEHINDLMNDLRQAYAEIKRLKKVQK